MDQECSNRIISEDYADFIIQSGSSLNDLRNQLDICYTPINDQYVVIYTPITGLPDRFIHLVGYYSYPKCFGLMDIPSLQQSGINRVRNVPTLNLLGQGVLIGLIDTGIEYTHEAFKNADGTSRVLSIWDQTIQNENARPPGLYYGTEYSQEQINEALRSPEPLSIVPSTDTNGHGTALAGIAAGNVNEENNFSGVAPGAEFVVVKLKEAKRFTREFWKIPEGPVCYQQNDILLGIRYLIEKAASVNRPISIIIGVGTSQGAHDDRGFLSNILSNQAALSGVCISVSAGNEGSSMHHYRGQIQQGSKYDTMELNVGPNETGFSMEIWGKAPNTFSIDISSPSGEYIARIPARLNENQVVRFIFERTIINIDYQIIESETGDQLILLRFTEPAEGIWRFRVYLSGDLSADFHTWLPITPFLGTGTYFIRPDPYTTITSPGNTTVPIVATAYNYTNETLFIDASRGFTRDNNISPTLAAPGVNLVAPALGNTYAPVTGTSIAAAHTAGVGALLLEWGVVRNRYSQMDSIDIRNILIRGTVKNPNFNYPNREWGYGILNLYNSFTSLSGEGS
jgi:subtilisin family serine protease